MTLNKSLPGKQNDRMSLQDWLRYAAGYSLFLVFLLLAGFLLFRLRVNLVQIGFLLGHNQVWVKGFSNLGVLIIGVLLLIAVILCEDYLRKGMETNDLRRRALRVFLIEGGLIAFSLVLYYALLQAAI